MNGEIPGVPITTLAGIASVTDRKFKLLLPIAEKPAIEAFFSVRVSSAIGLRTGRKVVRGHILRWFFPDLVIGRKPLVVQFWVLNFYLLTVNEPF